MIAMPNYFHVSVTLARNRDSNFRRCMDLSNAAADSIHMTLQDPDILSSIRGDPGAYRRVMERHQAGVTRHLMRFTRQRATLEELLHDTFVEAYLALPRFRFEAPFEHYLQRIATRVGYGYWTRTRRAARHKPLADAPELVAPAEYSREAGELLSLVLDGLSPRDRLVVTLLYLDQHSVSETAALTGWSQTMVKVQAFRARRKLRKLLTELDPDLEKQQ